MSLKKGETPEAKKEVCDFCGLNTGPLDLQSNALPTELKPQLDIFAKVLNSHNPLSNAYIINVSSCYSSIYNFCQSTNK